MRKKEKTDCAPEMEEEPVPGEKRERTSDVIA
jgi:hypothetical protein